MAALRRWQPEFKGGSPLDNSQSPSPCGNHERAMMVACLGSCAAGTTLGFSSAAMPSIEHEPWYKLPHSYPENRWGEAVFLLGASGGALLSGFLLRFAGNRKTLLLSAFGLLCAWVGLMSCNSIAAFMASRVACGLWLGVTANSALVYVTDVAPPTKRAFFGGLTEVALGAGTLAASTLESARWELQATVCAVWPVMVFALQHYLVESPRWLHDRGSRQEANIAAARLFGIDLPPELRAKKEGEPVHSYRCLKQIRVEHSVLKLSPHSFDKV
ncbi:hypothetical protein V5799_016715 [Amblyomma americanum]|uniref:Major facilitator superfamily (MFS) profile domain-containing protein n=1 Tax=Amblyomma americanum TaxID=6943 RepID=A0AAQ4F523_AMBAM